MRHRARGNPDPWLGLTESALQAETCDIGRGMTKGNPDPWPGLTESALQVEGCATGGGMPAVARD
jgi:hypothetical protein